MPNTLFNISFCFSLSSFGYSTPICTNSRPNLPSWLYIGMPRPSTHRTDSGGSRSPASDFSCTVFPFRCFSEIVAPVSESRREIFERTKRSLPRRRNTECGIWSM